jgi:hypothetical protein
MEQVPQSSEAQVTHGPKQHQPLPEPLEFWATRYFDDMFFFLELIYQGVVDDENGFGEPDPSDPLTAMLPHLGQASSCYDRAYQEAQTAEDALVEMGQHLSRASEIFDKYVQQFGGD